MFGQANDVATRLFEDVPGSPTWLPGLKELVRFAKVTPPRELEAQAPEVRRHILFALCVVRATAKAVRERTFEVASAADYASIHSWCSGRAAHAPGWNEQTRSLDQLQWPIEVVERVAAAAGKVTAILEQLAGPSLQQLRHDVWRACFGRSLYRAWPTREVRQDQCVLVLGPSGTGKELVAEAIAAGSLHGGAYVITSGGQIHEHLAHSQLFGHEKGSFTGADSDKVGLLEAAHLGTLFLDELPDLPPAVQNALLRALGEERQVVRLSARNTATPRPARCRLVCATSRDLQALVETGTFRADLHARLSDVVIRTVPLSRRSNAEIVELGRGLLLFELRSRGGSEGLPDSALLDSMELPDRYDRELAPVLVDRTWDTNVRGLRAAVRLWVATQSAELVAAHLTEGAATFEEIPVDVQQGRASLEEVEQWYVAKVAELHKHNKSRIAEVLKLARNTVIKKLRET